MAKGRRDTNQRDVQRRAVTATNSLPGSAGSCKQNQPAIKLPNAPHIPPKLRIDLLQLAERLAEFVQTLVGFIRQQRLFL